MYQQGNSSNPLYAFYKSVKDEIYLILDMESELSGGEPNDHLFTKIFNYFIISLIILNVIAFALDTFNSISVKYGEYLLAFEIISVALFTIEYILRLWTCTNHSDFQDPIKGRFKYMTSIWAIIDMCAILPFYLPMVTLDLRFIRSLRILRLFRLFKLGRYNDKLRIFMRVLNRKKDDLILATVIGFFLLFLSASLMYFVESEAQPENFSNILDAMWWGLIPVTTVGYGDVYPITPMGKLLGGIITFLGVIIIALPIGIFSSGFEEEMRFECETKECNCIEKTACDCPYVGKYCPHTGVFIEDKLKDTK